MSREDWFPFVEAAVDRFWSKVERARTCWLWTAGKDKDGYGKFSIGPSRAAQVSVLSHRFALATSLGRVPHGLVLHSCDTPACCNPAHLSEGTAKENMEQYLTRIAPRLGHTRLSFTAAVAIRARRARGESLAALATDYGVSRNAIWLVVHGKAWVHAS